MPTLLPEDARQVLQPAVLPLIQSIEAGWATLRELSSERRGRYGRSLRARTRAALLHDFVVEDAVERLPYPHFVSNDVDLWQIGELAVRFKKLGDDGLPKNVHTQHNSALCNDGENLEIFQGLKVSYLTIGYDVDPAWRKLGDLWVMYLVSEKHVGWTISLRADGKAVPMDNFSPDLLPPKPRSRVEVLAKERGRREA